MSSRDEKRTSTTEMRKKIVMVDTFRCQKRHERLGDEKEEWKNGKVLAEETALKGMNS